MCTWFAQERLKGMMLSGPILQAQATKFGNLTGDESFQASKGFISRFKKRHGIAQVSISGESRSADESAAKAFPTELQSILQNEDYHEEQLYNCDETALFAKLLPDETLAFNYETQKTAGFKKIKDCVTLLFSSNKMGSHKLTPLLTGCFHNPRCFNHLNRAKLPVIYANSKNAWMTRRIFDDWFHNSFVPAVRKHLRSKKLEAKALLLLSNCPAHPPAESLLKKAWDGVKRTSIENYWMKALGDASSVKDRSDSENSSSGTDSEPDFEGFSEDVLKTRMQTKEDKSKLLFQMIKDFSLDTSPEIITEWLEMDEDCPTSEFLSEEEILTGCEATSDHESDGENSNNAGLNDNDEDVVEKVKISPKEALSAVETVVRFMEEQNVENIENIHLRQMTDFIREKKM
ncbi:jerky protein homolog-like [Malaclemys terrapin pileata]|uniref:jerky protein homolog-like n=1 Tax=Malaclemys terrapin pileata TaxID=2991368 RepID=UPI0023A82D0A|nr:jerky protein homolog-like [Malaclemys terrapin pileata]